MCGAEGAGRAFWRRVIEGVGVGVGIGVGVGVGCKEGWVRGRGEGRQFHGEGGGRVMHAMWRGGKEGFVGLCRG